mgnify:CR=1 FL=1
MERHPEDLMRRTFDAANKEKKELKCWKLSQKMYGHICGINLSVGRQCQINLVVCVTRIDYWRHTNNHIYLTFSSGCQIYAAYSTLFFRLFPTFQRFLSFNSSRNCSPNDISWTSYHYFPSRLGEEKD